MKAVINAPYSYMAKVSCYTRTHKKLRGAGCRVHFNLIGQSVFSSLFMDLLEIRIHLHCFPSFFNTWNFFSTNNSHQFQTSSSSIAFHYRWGPFFEKQFATFSRKLALFFYECSFPSSLAPSLRPLRIYGVSSSTINRRAPYSLTAKVSSYTQTQSCGVQGAGCIRF